jgi:predicted DNA-binding protein
MNRHYIVTNRTSPIAAVTTQIKREMYNRLQVECDKLKTTKGALVRRLVEQFLSNRTSNEV